MKPWNSLPVLAAALLAVFATGAPWPACAGLDEEMRARLGAMINVTPGGYYQGQRRGVITGGSIYARAHVSNPNLIAYQPPRIKAGCGGIDLFSGSISFINAQQFEDLLRNIASNAGGYAFGLALEAMCPSCAQEIEKLQKKVQELNGMLRNSCEAGKFLVNQSGYQGWIEQQKREGGIFAATNGVGTDVLAAINGYLPSAPNVFDNAAAAGQMSKLTGNVIRSSIERANLTSWFVGGDAALKDVLANVTGMLVIVDGRTDDGSERALNYRYYGPRLRVADLLNGGTRRIYSCPDEACLEPVATDLTFTGLRIRVRNLLFGASGGAGGGGGGILSKLRSRGGAATFTDEEARFVEASPVGVLGLLKQFGEDPAAAQSIAEQAVDVVAAQLAAGLVAETLAAVRAAVTSSGKPLDNAMLQVIRDVADDVREEQASAARSQAAIAQLFAVSQYTRARLREIPSRAEPAAVKR